MADSSRRLIVRVDDMTGAGWVQFGRRSPKGGIGQFDCPTGIAIDATDRIYVADPRNGRVARMDDMTGAGWTILGGTGSGFRRFAHPNGIALDAAGRIYVAESEGK